MTKPILCLDFDGVLHSYVSGWKGARNIPDPPTDGALKFIVNSLDHFTIAIYSSRSHQWVGRRAMKRWLYRHFVALDNWSEEVNPHTGETEREEPPRWWLDHVGRVSAMEPWDVSVRDVARGIVKAIQWPNHKPSAMITIDDRALTFNGDWNDPAYSPDGLRNFRPWNKRIDKIEMPSNLISNPAFQALRKASL